MLHISNFFVIFITHYLQADQYKRSVYSQYFMFLIDRYWIYLHFSCLCIKHSVNVHVIRTWSECKMRLRIGAWANCVTAVDLRSRLNQLVKNHINLRKYCFMEAIAKVSKVSCCLHMYFLWRHHFPPDKSENDQDSDYDWFTYCIDIWLLTLLFSPRYLSESCFGNDNTFFITQPLSCFVFHSPAQPCTHLKFCLPNPFPFGSTTPPPPPSHK